MTRRPASIIVRKALSWPARQIVINAGEDGSIIVGKILEKDQYGFGFDAQNGEYVNLVSKGIIDPTKVVRAALQNAASIAGLLITTEAMVAERPRKDSGAAAMPGGGMGGMGGMDYMARPKPIKSRPVISFRAFSRKALVGEEIFMTDSNEWHNPSEDYPPTRPGRAVFFGA